MRALTTLLLLSALVAAPGSAQESTPSTDPVAAAQHAAAGNPENEKVDIITPHITDSYELELPMLRPPFYHEVCIGRHEANGRCGPLWNDVGSIGALRINLSPSKHVVMMLVAATLAALILVGAARAHVRHTSEHGSPKGFAAGIETLVLYLRNEVVLPNIGPHGEAFVPYVSSLFFFILFANLLGLIPFGSTATGNVSVTAALAIMTFIVIEISGMRAQGVSYFNRIFYWNRDLPLVVRIPMFLIMTPVEIVGKLAKPFALAIRLFANMTAGHIVVLAFIGLIITFRSLASGAPFLGAVAIMMLEIFVALLQAYIFTLLSAVFIGQIREAHH